MATGERELTAPEVAERLHVHIDTVRRWLHSGKLKGYRFSTKTGWRVPESSLAAFIKAAAAEADRMAAERGEQDHPDTPPKLPRFRKVDFSDKFKRETKQ